MTYIKAAFVIVLILFCGWGALVISSYSILLREDPMYVNEANVMEDVACIYFTGLTFRTILITGRAEGAECQRLWSFKE
jgi:hypothetical protein